MASLSEDQKSAVRLALGYPDLWRYRDTRLESVMNSVSDQAVTQITSILASIVTVEASVLQAAADAADNVRRVDEITFQDARADGTTVGFTSARIAARYLVNKLSIILGCPVWADAYGTKGYPGDFFIGGKGDFNFG